MGAGEGDLASAAAPGNAAATSTAVDAAAEVGFAFPPVAALPLPFGDGAGSVAAPAAAAFDTLSLGGRCDMDAARRGELATLAQRVGGVPTESARPSREAAAGTVVSRATRDKCAGEGRVLLESGGVREDTRRGLQAGVSRAQSDFQRGPRGQLLCPHGSSSSCLLKR